MRAVAKRLSAACEQNGIACLDTTDRFVNEAVRLAQQGERLYYKFDWHWNAHGHQLAAELLAKYILANLLPEQQVTDGGPTGIEP